MPKQKCALLYGPPGLGKTTLAHIIAATAGYNVVEMNASDDRSLDKFQQKLEAATQMKRYHFTKVRGLYSNTEKALISLFIGKLRCLLL